MISNNANSKQSQTIENVINEKKPFVLELSKKTNSVKLSSKRLFKDSDIDQIKDWVNKKDKDNFDNDYFKLSLKDNILLFRKIDNKTSIILLGYVLEQSILNRLLLLEMRQKYLMGIL